MTKMICHCGDHYDARDADLLRGWSLSCSKSCAAKRRDKRLPAAKRADGEKLKVSKKEVKKRNSYAKRGTPPKREWEYTEHPHSDEALGQW